MDVHTSITYVWIAILLGCHCVHNRPDKIMYNMTLNNLYTEFSVPYTV